MNRAGNKNEPSPIRAYVPLHFPFTLPFLPLRQHLPVSEEKESRLRSPSFTDAFEQ